jgi:hypothetical protein
VRSIYAPSKALEATRPGYFPLSKARIPNKVAISGGMGVTNPMNDVQCSIEGVSQLVVPIPIAIGIGTPSFEMTATLNHNQANNSPFLKVPFPWGVQKDYQR